MDNRKLIKIDKENNDMEFSETAENMDYIQNSNFGYQGNHNINRGMFHAASVPEYTGGSLARWRLSTLRPDNEKRHSSIFRNSLHWEEFFGSSLDLTPTLLGLYDQIASTHREIDEGPHHQSDEPDALTNQNDQHEAMDQNEDSKVSSAVLSDKTNFETNANLLESRDTVKPIIRINSDNLIEPQFNKVKMEGNENGDIADIDNKKRPLSLSSMSSSSTSSLPRQRKRPNLCEYSDSSSSGQLDIEKLDNLLYIDDNAQVEIPNPTDDEMSLYSIDKEEKSKSMEDSDSQISLDQSSLRDQALIADQQNFNQSDTNITFSPSNSEKSSASDLQKMEESSGNLNRDTPTRSPSRTSLGSRTTGSVKQSGHYVSHVQRVVAEIVETERIYVKHLQEIKLGYYENILRTPSLKISGPELKCLFGNIVDIYNFSRHFLEHLESCGMDPIQVADCFVQNNQGFVIYAEYCTNYPSAVGVLCKVMHDPYLSEFFKQRQIALGHSLPLGAYLLKPVQRVLKYHLLLQNILKHYSKSDPGYSKLTAAFDHMTDMSHQINEMKRKHEHAVRVQEIQSQLEDYEGEDFTRLGDLVLEGSFRMHGVKASRQLFLFKRGVIIAKRKEDGMLSCKVYIPCAKLMLVESIPGEPLNFQILPFDNPKLTHTIHARNLDQKRKWCREIKRLMLESYSSKIPENVKDLIMQKLGQSKEEEDFVNIGGTESSKSHVSTPDYLEKRQKVRRKSGNLIGGIPDILKQRGRKIQARSRAETPSPKSSPVIGNALPYDKHSSHNTQVEHYGFRANIPGHSPLTRNTKIRNKATVDPSTIHKRPVSIQRSHSFQHSSRDPLRSEGYGLDSSSMENLTSSEGPPIRTNSFRLATRLSPIRLEATDETDSKSEISNLDNVLTSRLDNDNIPSAIRKSIDDEMKKLDKNSNKVDNLNLKNIQRTDQNVEDMGLRKRGRFSSMPALNSEQKSPKVSRLHSERLAYSPTINRTGVSNTKQLDIKNYFSWNKDWLNSTESQRDNNKENESSNLSREAKPVLAFHDVFSNLKKSSENITSKPVSQKSVNLTQPKPFASTLKKSASKIESHAKLDKWKTDDKFTKGSLVDVSHLKEDPWIPSKPRSSTESSIFSKDLTSKLSDLNTFHMKDCSHKAKPDKEPKGRLSLDEGSNRHVRTQSFTGDDRCFSKDNLDWLVYANRNSLPVSGLSTEDLLHYKYCTPPRGSMIPPSPQGVSPFGKKTLHENVVSTYGTPSRGNTKDYQYTSYGNHTETTTDSSVSLSATNTSSETCSSPDILKDSVFDEAFSPEKFFSPGNARLERSFSSPDNKRSSKFRRDLNEDRPSSMDILAEVGHIEASEKLVAEMEHYMKHSSSSSSLSSTHNKFPQSIPTFEENGTYKRDSVLSTGSSSSYESAREDPESEQETIVESIKSKFHNITSKFGGKKLSIDQAQHLKSPRELSAPSSPAKKKLDEHSSKSFPLAHNLSLRLKPGHPKTTVEPSLPSLLLESQPGSEVIGSRMAHPDFDDYATFSLPRSQTPQSNMEDNKKVVEKRRSETYFKPLSYLSGPKSVSQSVLASKYSPVSSLRNLHIQQSDSAFSIQSADIDSSTPSDSPRSETDNKPADNDNADNFYERRLSIAFNTNDEFRDSAVYCDDLDTPVVSPREPIVPLKVPIKEYVQKLEEKNKSCPPSPVKVKPREPGAIVKQRLESLQANLDNQKSSSTSRSLSSTTSRTQSTSTSRDTSRAPSEEKQVTSSALKELIDHKFPMERTLSLCVDQSDRQEDEEFFRSRSSTSGSGKLKAAYSLGRLDQLSMDVDNLTIMKGWVRQLIDKFQSEK